MRLGSCQLQRCRLLGGLHSPHLPCGDPWTSARDPHTPCACRASAKLTNLQIEALQGPCIMHRRGRLLVQGCALHSRAQGELGGLLRLISMAALLLCLGLPSRLRQVSGH